MCIFSLIRVRWRSLRIDTGITILIIFLQGMHRIRSIFWQMVEQCVLQIMRHMVYRNASDNRQEEGRWHLRIIMM